MNAWVAFWLAWIAAFCVVEALAFLTGGTTLSRVVWTGLGMPVARPFIVALGAWLAWHWFVEGYFPAMRGRALDDGAIAALAGLFSAVFGRRR